VYGLKAAFLSEGSVSSALEVPESLTSLLFLLFFGEAGGGECVEAVASDSASFSEEAADL
jgi:hypothetical protein